MLRLLYDLCVLYVLLAAIPTTVSAQSTKSKTAPAKITRIDVKAPKDIDVKSVIAKSGLKIGDSYSKTAVEDAAGKVSAAVGYDTHYFLDADSVKVSSTVQG